MQCFLLKNCYSSEIVELHLMHCLGSIHKDDVNAVGHLPERIYILDIKIPCTVCCIKMFAKLTRIVMTPS